MSVLESQTGQTYTLHAFIAYKITNPQNSTYSSFTEYQREISCIPLASACHIESICIMDQSLVAGISHKSVGEAKMPITDLSALGVCCHHSDH
jgi:hypothetical protein